MGVYYMTPFAHNNSNILILVTSCSPHQNIASAAVINLRPYNKPRPELFQNYTGLRPIEIYLQNGRVSQKLVVSFFFWDCY